MSRARQFSRWWDQPPRNDASTVIGLQTPAAVAVASLFLLMSVLLSAHSLGEVANWWQFSLVFALAALAIGVLIFAPGDPMEPLPTAAICIVICSLPMLAMPAVHGLGMGYGITAGGICGAVLAFLCVRGRVLAAWGVFLGNAAGIWLTAVALNSEPFQWLAVVLPNTAVLLMATLFAAIVRPAAREIYALRAQTAAAAAEEAAAQAALAERDDQLRRLDSQARPLLERIASGGELTADEVARCALVESRLRDGIRARGLDSPQVVEAVWEARARGVVVRLLDDSGAETGGEGADVAARRQHVLARLRDTVAAEVSTCGAGASITVRVYPRRREDLASIVLVGPDDMKHIVYDANGVPVATAE